MLTQNIAKVKLGYDEHAWDRPVLLVIVVIRCSLEYIIIKVTIWDQKFGLGATLQLLTVNNFLSSL